jgi:hypothetical protein
MFTLVLCFRVRCREAFALTAWPEYLLLQRGLNLTVEKSMTRDLVENNRAISQKLNAVVIPIAAGRLKC